MEDGKKLSFGFSKISKKPSLFKHPLPSKDSSYNGVQFIESFENQEIKTITEQKIAEAKEPLVIPMPQSKKRISVLPKRVTTETKNEKSESELTEDEIAARELIKEATELKKDDTKKPSLIIDLLQAKEEATVEEIVEEPTMDDYENVPISEIGKAMLRGMNWKEGDPIGLSNTKSYTEVKEPVMRVGRMGLGIDMSLMKKATTATSEQAKSDDKELILKTGSYAKVTEGKHEGYYCEVQGFDDVPGRILVKLALKGATVSLPEFFVQVVKKEEYDRLSRVINNAKYEQYKASIDQGGVVDRSKVKKEEKANDKIEEKTKDKKEEKYSDSKEERNRDRKEERHSYRKEERNSYKKEESHRSKRDESDEEYRSRKHSKKKSKSKRHESDSEDERERSYKHKKRSHNRDDSDNDKYERSKSSHHKKSKHSRRS